MTLIENDSPKVQYTGPFVKGQLLPLTFPYIAKTDVYMLIDGVPAELNTEFEIITEVSAEHPVAYPNSAYIKNALPNAKQITIYRSTPLDQQAPFPQNSKFRSERIEQALDKLTMQQQEQEEQLSRCIIAPITLETFNGQLPEPAADQALKWNTEGTELENYDIIGEQEAFENDVNTRFEEQSAAFENRITSFEEETNTQFAEFRAEINENLETVLNAADQLEKLDASVQITEKAASQANAAATRSAEASQLAQDYAEQSEAFAQSAQDSYNNFQQSVDGALSNIDSSVQEGVDVIYNTKTEIINDIEFVADGEKEEIRDIIDTGKDEIQELTNEIKDNAEDIINRVGISMFDTILKDHVLTYEESKGLALQGTYVYKEAIAGSRYGYPDFYAKCLEEFQEAQCMTWTQPRNMTSNGTLGGTSFACKQRETNNGDFYHCINGGAGESNFWYNTINTGEFVFYNPIPLNITQMVWIPFDANRNPINYTVQGSADGIIYEDIVVNQTATAGSSTTMNLSTNKKFYKYYKLIINSFNTGQGNCKTFTITATQDLYINNNGHRFYDISNKSYIDSVYNKTGMAWMYGIDQENERIFLPRNNWFDQLTFNSSEVGDSIEAGLPNITSETYLYTIAGGDSYGAITMTDTGASYRVGDGGTTGRTKRLDLNASNSSPVYGKSNTVQPNAVKKLLYICVGNTVSDTSWVDVVTQVEGGVKDLEDKTNEGIEKLKQSSTALTQAQITNCILEIPQRIKYDLTDGVLTLKAGSVVIVPYGTEDLTATYPVGSTFINENFTVYDTQYEDGKFFVWAELVNNIVVIVPASTRTGALVDIAITNSIAFPAVAFTSGGTAPTAGRYYNTINNKYYDMSNIEGTLSFPILSCDFIVNTGFTSVNQVFNGFGYIGSTIWVDKGVKCLIPNGRNADGTLNNIEYITQNVTLKTQTASGWHGRWTGYLKSNGVLNHHPTELHYISETKPSVWTTTAYWGNPAENKLYYTNDFGVSWEQAFDINIFNFTESETKVTSLKAKQSFKAVDYNDIKGLKTYIIETYCNGDSWYRIWSDGWCEQGGFITQPSANYTATITFLKPFASTNWGYSDMLYVTAWTGNNWAIDHSCGSIKNKTNSSFTRDIGMGASYRWRAYGYIA